MQLSPVVAGLWRLNQWGFDKAGLLDWITQALDLGVSSFDHADIYGGYTAEALFGAALAAAPGLRQRMQLVTKCGIRMVHPNRPAIRLNHYDTGRAHVLASVDNSLRCLHTEHVDLLLFHRPDLLMQPDELAQVCADLRRAGKVLHFGVSNHTPGQLAMLHRRLPLVTHQVELSLLQMQALADGTLEQCMDLGLRPMIWSPLAGGRLLGGDGEQQRRVHVEMNRLALQHEVSPATIAYAWILRHPSRPLPITGSRRPAALQEAMAALQVRLSAEDWYALWQASMGHGVA